MTDAPWQADELAAEVVCELIGRQLATALKADGSLLLPREDWLAIMRLAAVEGIRYFKSLTAREEYMDILENNYCLQHDFYYFNYLTLVQLSEAARTKGDFYFLKILREAAFAGPGNEAYTGRLSEIVAHSLYNSRRHSQDQPLTETQLLLRAGLLREDKAVAEIGSGCPVYRGAFFDGRVWRKYLLAKTPAGFREFPLAAESGIGEGTESISITGDVLDALLESSL